MERLMPSLGIGGKLRLEVIWFFKTLSGGGFLPLIAGLQTSSLLSPFFHPLRPLFPQPVFSLLVCLSISLSVWAYHSMERQRKRRRRAGQRSSSMAEAWPLPRVSSFCRLARSTCRDGPGSGLGLP